VSDRLVAATALYALVLAAWAAALAVRGRAPAPALAAGALLLQGAVVAQALGSVVAWAAGDPPAASAEHGGYLVVAVLVLPAAWAYAGGAPGGWRSAVAGAAAAALAVVTVRLWTTWAVA